MNYNIQVTDITPDRFKSLINHLGIQVKQVGKYLNISGEARSHRLANRYVKYIGLEEIYAVKAISKAKFGTVDAFGDALIKMQLEEIAVKLHLRYKHQAHLQLVRKRIEAEKQIKAMSNYIFQLEQIIETSQENKKTAGKYKKKVFELPELLEEINDEELIENENSLNDEINDYSEIRNILSNNSLLDLKNTWLKMPEQKIEELILASIHQDPDKIKEILNEALK
ncbi:MAG: hypothetical protein NTW25_15735 [Candidatus Kapabacteria bacterium]|nr:hypothetical protein [Candidatus Kapabacteria bacterium]